MNLLVIAFTLVIFSADIHALTDTEALANGMVPIEQHVVNSMKAVITPGLNSEGVKEAVRKNRLVIAVNKAAIGPDAQTLTIYENGVEILKEKISTGREKEERAKSGRVYVSSTPKGFFRPTKVYKDYLSYAWKAQMPNAVFFNGGVALHATTESHYAELGSRASGGCIRLKLEDSATLRDKVMEMGKGSQPGQFKVVREAMGRNRIHNNTVAVKSISRYSGAALKQSIQSWDAVIIVYEE